MIRATIKLLPEEADALIQLLEGMLAGGSMSLADPSTHSYRAASYVAAALKHERARRVSPK